MIIISPEAQAYIREKNNSIYFDCPPLIGCCIHLKESPTIRFGIPYDVHNYDKTEINQLIVYIPHELPDIPLSVVLASFLGFKRLAVEGWQLA